jgi:hypothetical protein
LEYLIPISYIRRAMGIYSCVDRVVRSACFHRGRAPKHWLYSVCTTIGFKTVRQDGVLVTTYRSTQVLYSLCFSIRSINGQTIVLAAHVGLYTAGESSCKSLGVVIYNILVA